MADLSKIIKDKTRREILFYLYNKGKATYSEILHDLNLSTGRLNYHLKILEPFLVKEESYYKLNDKGKQLVEIMQSVGEEKKENRKLLPQFLALASFVLLIVAGTAIHDFNAFVAFYSLSLVLLLSSVYFLYTQEEVSGLENIMILLSLFIPYVLVFTSNYDVFILPLYLVVTYTVKINFTIYSLIPVLIYYFGVLPKFMNYNEKLLMGIIVVMLLVNTLEGFSASYIIDLSPLLLATSLVVNRDRLENKNVFLFFAFFDLAIIVASIVFKLLVIRTF